MVTAGIPDAVVAFYSNPEIWVSPLGSWSASVIFIKLGTVEVPNFGPLRLPQRIAYVRTYVHPLPLSIILKCCPEFDS